VGQASLPVTSGKDACPTKKYKILDDKKLAVYVKPEIVVEVAYNEIQKRPHYKSGFALRFARITRTRDDKNPQQADTIGRLKELYGKQFQRKAKAKWN